MMMIDKKVPNYKSKTQVPLCLPMEVFRLTSKQTSSTVTAHSDRYVTSYRLCDKTEN